MRGGIRSFRQMLFGSRRSGIDPYLCRFNSLRSEARTRNESHGLVIARSLGNLLFLVIVGAALAACGTGMSIAPPGGPADTTAPRVVETSPANGSVNVHDRSITVKFSEYVEETTVPANMVITPLPSEPPDYDWSGRELEITFHKPLLENRTYTVTFGAAITDLSTNRLGQPFTVRFATGERIDSARILGIVDNVNRRQALIFVYTIGGDSAAFAGRFRPDSVKPDFVAPVGDDGRFSVEGLPPGHFRLFAVADDGADQLFTPGTDAYGVPQGDVRIDSAGGVVSGVRMRLRSGPDDMAPPSLYSAVSINRTRTELRFSEPIDTAGIGPGNFTLVTPTGTVPVSLVWRSPANDISLLLAHGELAAGSQDTIRLSGLRDTVGNAIVDSASTLGFVASAAPDTLPPTLLPIGLDSAKGYTFPDSIRIGLDEAAKLSDPNGVVVMRDTAKARAAFRLQQISPALWLAFPLDTLYGVQHATIEVNLGRFTDLAGNHHDSVARIRITVAPMKQTGTLEGTLTDTLAPNSLHVIALHLTGTNVILTQKRVRGGKWTFQDIPEGEYEVSAFRDADGNGQYDYGSVIPFRFGEAFTNWHGTVRVRPRWVTNKVDLVIGR